MPAPGRRFVFPCHQPSMKHRLSLLPLGGLFLLPFLWRLGQSGLAQPIGLLSDLASGALVMLLALASPRWLRAPLVLLWAGLQAGSRELFAAMQRYPNWQDALYLLDPEFVRNSTSGLHLSSPVLAALILALALTACCLPLRRVRAASLFTGLILAAGLFLAHDHFNDRNRQQSIAARYNPFQWLLADALAKPLPSGKEPAPLAVLPPGLRQVDLNGTPLLHKGRAQNVLIVALEGIPGLYYPAIREAMGVPPQRPEMNRLAQATTGAMLMPDFVTHSHQTIRGLYSILCGDISELSFKTPKAIELLGLPEQAGQCLPAQMAKNGWDTHYLQASGLTFMGKDRVMPSIGFKEVHGSEWFPAREENLFEWGVTDTAFFKGAKEYIAGLRKKEQPWMLTLLTVGTHQPYSVPDEIADRYPTRRDAAVAMLDQAVADFITGLRKDGVLDDTLVLITSDESQGHALAEWVCSWGLGIVLAPEQEELPRLKEGTFALMDVAASILDYFHLDIPPSVIGRSFFRQYDQPREMVAYTADKLRWHTSSDLLYECTRDEGCLVGKAPSLLGFTTSPLLPDSEDHAPRLFAAASALDNKLIEGKEQRLLQFAAGEIRTLPEKIRDEWADNLIGAQYLDFPANSKTRVTIRVRAIQAPDDGVQLKLSLRQWENLVTDISFSDFPLLRAGEESTLEFDFDNPEDRKAFSFHLTGEGKESAIQIDEFNVTVM